jgi:predicted alpha/beta superfamily hydrolase
MKKPAFILPAPETGTGYWIHVRKPHAPEPWTAVIVLDGDDMFTTAVKARDALPDSPPLLMIGVGYGGGFKTPQNRRVRDYTPVRAHDEPSSGGADKFLAFLTDSLWPELTRRYPVREDTRAWSVIRWAHCLFCTRSSSRGPFSPTIWRDRPPSGGATRPSYRA